MASGNKKEAGAEQVPVRVWLGNRAPIEEIDGERRPIPVPKTCTFVAPVPEGLLDQARDITALWPHVSDDPAPAWVASTRPELAALLSSHWDGIEVREPENPDVMHGPYKVVDEGAK